MQTEPNVESPCRALRWIAVAAVVALSAPHPASAQTELAPDPVGADDAQLQEAVRLSELGRLHFDGGEFAAAAEAFSRAWDLHHDSVLGYNAARSFENAGDAERALEYYRLTLTLPMDDPELRRRCDHAVRRIENLLRELEAERLREPARLSVVSDPDGAALTIDSELRGSTPLDVVLPAGEYAIRLQLAGHETHEESIALEPGQPMALRVTLPEIPALAPQPLAEDYGPDWLAVGLTGGAGGLLVALGALAAVAARDEHDRAQTPAVQRDANAFETAVDDGRNLQSGSSALYGLGFAAIATAVVLYLVTDDTPDDSNVASNGALPQLGWRF